MLIELGNGARKHAVDGSPAVTRIHVPDSYSLEPGIDVSELRSAMDFKAVRRADGVTRLPDHEALVSVLHPFEGAWQAHSFDDPTWAWSDNAEMNRVLQELHQVGGAPADVHDTHWSFNGSRILAPGVIPAAAPDVNMLVTDVGRALFAANYGGGQAGTLGTATAITATTLTTGAIASVTSNQYAGSRIYTPTAWANIISHTSGTTPVFTVDRWYTYATPGGSAAPTPGSTTTWVIPDGGSVSNWFVGLTSTNITPAHGDTSLSGEVTTNGLGRKIAPYALTSGTSPLTYTLTPVFTYTSSGAVTVFAIGVFNSMVVSDTTDTMAFETSLSSSATVSSNGDQITVTETVTGP